MRLLLLPLLQAAAQDYRFTITKNAGNNPAKGLQLAELSLLDAGGLPLTVEAITNPGGSNAAGSPANVNQMPASLIDGILSSKWFDGSAAC